MKHTQEEIINALKVIKDECDAIDDGYCMKCPFFKVDRGCLIYKTFPKDWNIVAEEEVWRALK